MTDIESPQIQALKQRYRESLAEKIELIEQQINLIVAAEADAGSLEEAHQVLHKLAGSSGMYGYDDINLLCRKVMSGLGGSSVDDSVNALNQIAELLEQHR